MSNLKDYPLKICQNHLKYFNNKELHGFLHHPSIKKHYIHNLGSKGLVLSSGGKSNGKVTKEC